MALQLFICCVVRVYPLQSCRFCASVLVGPVMSQYLFLSVPALLFICELNDGFEHVVNSL